MNVFHLQIIACERVFYDGDCQSLIFNGFDGRMQILAHHSPMATTVAVGEVRFRDGEGTEHTVIVSDGMVKVENNTAVLLALSADRPEDIDIARERQAMETAREQMQQKQSIVEYNLSSAAMARAMARLSGAMSIHSDNLNI